MRKRMNAWAGNALWCIAAMILLSIFVLNVIYHTTISYDASEKVTIHVFWAAGLLMLLLAALLVLLLRQFSMPLERLNQRLLFLLLSLVYCAFAAYLIANSSAALRSDAGTVYRIAQEFRRGNFDAFAEGGYMSVYPHQLGLMMFDLLLSFLATTPVLNFCVNLLMVLGINCFCWKISRELSGDRMVHFLTLMLSFAFFPQLFFIMFVYGQIPGLFFLCMGFYFTLRFDRTASRASCLGMLLCISVAVVLRKNNMIGAIAIVLYLLLQWLDRKSVRRLMAAVMAVVCMLVPGRLLQGYVEGKTHADLDAGCPNVLWIAMGTDIENETLGPGWYNKYTYQTFSDTGFRQEQAAELGKEKLRENLSNIVRNPGKAASFFCRKVISTWCDPLYQSIWSGPMKIFDQTTYTPLLLSLYGDGKAEDFADMCAKFVTLLLYAGVCAFLFLGGRRERGWELMFLYMIGGVLFHLFWETKSQYVYPYVFCLIPFSASGLCRLMHFAGKGMRQRDTTAEYRRGKGKRSRACRVESEAFRQGR